MDSLSFISVPRTNTEDVLGAATLPMRDLEDAMQVGAARVCDARHIVTRDARDFGSSPLPAIDAAEALQLISWAPNAPVYLSVAQRGDDLFAVAADDGLRRGAYGGYEEDIDSCVENGPGLDAAFLGRSNNCETVGEVVR